MLWELPLGLLSFALFHTLRFLVTLVIKHRRPPRLGGGPKWGVLDSRAIDEHLWVIMLIGPRWNTHATIAGTGVIRIERSLALDVWTANRSAEQWTGVLCRPDGTVACTIAGSEPTDDRRYRVLEVGPGNYTFTMRYYGARAGGLLPELRIDEDTAVPALPVPSTSLDVYHAVRDRTGLFYWALAWYIYPLLRVRRWLPAAFVTGEFLPAGNPRTSYAFDVVERRQRLSIDIPAPILASHRVMFTAFNRASFPTLWFPITATHTETEPMPQQGFWLLRFHGLSDGAPGVEPGQIAVTSA